MKGIRPPVFDVYLLINSVGPKVYDGWEDL